MKLFSNKVRAVVMIVTAILVTALSLVSASWSNHALAQGTVNIVPTGTTTATAVPKIAAVDCSGALVLPDVFDQMIAQAHLNPVPPAGHLCTLLHVLPLDPASFPDTFPEFQIDATGLFGVDPGTGQTRTSVPGPIAGYTRLTPAVQFAGWTTSSLRMCFDLPDGTLPATLRIGYYHYDKAKGLDRWVLLSTGTPANGQICMNRGLRSPLPAVFALFGK
jgi:hypothetical protein